MIYTIGYGNQQPDAFFARVPEGAIMVDVRAHPYSAWHQQFGAAALARRYRELYWGAPLLGNVGHVPDAWHPPSLVVAEGLLLGLAEALTRDGLDLVLLCAELAPDHCHRRLVAEALSAMAGGVDIHHLVVGK